MLPPWDEPEPGPPPDAPLRRGASVHTFTHRTGRVVELLPFERVAVELVLRPKGGERSPIRCAVIYSQSDVKVLGRA